MNPVSFTLIVFIAINLIQPYNQLHKSSTLDKWNKFSAGAILFSSNGDAGTYAADDQSQQFLELYSSEDYPASLDEFQARRYKRDRSAKRKSNVGRLILMREFRTNCQNIIYDFKKHRFSIPVPCYWQNGLFGVTRLQISEIYETNRECFFPLHFSSDEAAESWKNNSGSLNVEVLVKFRTYWLDSDDIMELRANLVGLCIYKGSAESPQIIYEAMNASDAQKKLIFIQH